MVGTWALGFYMQIPSRYIQFTGPAVSAMARMQGAIIACQQYSKQHAGRLPSSLQELGPEFRWIWQGEPAVLLETPGALLSELSTEAVMLSSAGEDTLHHQKVLFVVHPDWHIEHRSS